MKKIVTLSTEASKRLIAKGIAALPPIRRALKDGYIALSLGTTCGFLVEELSGKEIPRNRYACGHISPIGPCTLGPDEQYKLVVFDRGEMVQLKSKRNSLDFSEHLTKYLDKMDENDFFVKAGNVMDSAKNAAVLIGRQEAGEVGVAIPYIEKGISSLVPMLVSKTIPFSVEKLFAQLKNEKITKEWCDAEPHDVIPLPGEVFTEMDAAELLFDIELLPISIGGFEKNNGGTVFLLSGSEEKVGVAYDYLQQLEDEPQLQEYKALDCLNCPSYTYLREVKKQRIHQGK